MQLLQEVIAGSTYYFHYTAFFVMYWLKKNLQMPKLIREDGVHCRFHGDEL